MRIAVIADVHGNRWALEAVLRDIAARGADVTVNLGDCLSGPLDAAGTADVLASLELLTVRGNHDRQLLDRQYEQMGPSDQAAFVQLTGAHRAWLASFPPVAVLHDALLCHGTPWRDDRYLLEDVTARGVELATYAQVRERLGDAGERLVLCGHSHVARVVRLPDGTLVVNPGSVGLQAYADDTIRPHVVESGSPHARYALLDGRGDDWRVTLLLVRYDPGPAAAMARAADRVDWEHALLTGCL